MNDSPTATQLLERRLLPPDVSPDQASDSATNSDSAWSGQDPLWSDAAEPSPARIDLSTYRKVTPPADLVRRAIWECVQLPFYPMRPRSLSRVRVALLRMFGAKIGRNVLICGGVRVHVPWNLEIGDHAAIGDRVEIYNLAPIRIGDHTTISQHSYLCASSHDYTRSDFALYSLPITIGKQAWVAAGAFVAPGVTIGEGSVVGARSVVLRDVPPWTVAAGNPCKVIKPRVVRRDGDPV
jgi:putative colanic acid biosynthesis acetyltransferase WcaF